MKVILTLQILFADGTVSEFCYSSPLIPAELTTVLEPQQVVQDGHLMATKKSKFRCILNLNCA